MPITREEEIAVLYALHCCGGKATKSRVVEFIIRNELLQPRGRRRCSIFGRITNREPHSMVAGELEREEAAHHARNWNVANHRCWTRTTFSAGCLGFSTTLKVQFNCWMT